MTGKDFEREQRQKMSGIRPIRVIRVEPFA
jgi:hypothetical protein